MPPYAHLVEKDMDWSRISANVNAMVALGVPYDQATIDQAEALAKAQAREIAEKIKAENGPDGVENKRAIALIAYLMRLGVDINKPVEAEPAVAEETPAQTVDPNSLTARPQEGGR
jgi:cytochrome c oxidase cbb3-type subunit I/II